MPAQIRWIALRAAILATVVLGTAFSWTAGASAYDTGGTASTAATAGVDAMVDTLGPDGTTNTESAPPQMMNGDNDWDSGWWIVMAVMMVLFWGAVIALVVWGIRQFTGDQRRNQSALDIARERLARGEITKEEFDRIRGDLT